MRGCFVISSRAIALVLLLSSCAGDFTWSSSDDAGTFFGGGPIAKLFQHGGADAGRAVLPLDAGVIASSDAAVSSDGAIDASALASDGANNAATIGDDDADAGPTPDAGLTDTDPDSDAGPTTDCVRHNGGCDPLTVCSDNAGTHTCGACPAGYSGDGATGCHDIDECATNNGGCDRTTSCTNTLGAHACGACPPGFFGSGEAPCAPELIDLTLSAGVLVPALSADETEYVVNVPLSQASISLAPSLPDGASARIGDAVVSSGSAWTSGLLSLGDNAIEIDVSAPGQAIRSYTLHVWRAHQEAYLKASNTGTEDRFGESIAIAGDTLVIGAPGEASGVSGVDASALWQADDSAANSGAVYVFVRRDGTWSQEAYLKASDTRAGAAFGSSVAIAGDTLVIGAPGGALAGNGASYASAASGGANGVLTAASAGSSAPAATSGGGNAVTAASVGPNAFAALSGAAYVFVRSEGVWSQTASLSPSLGADGSVPQQFGARVAIADDTLAISAHGSSQDGTASARSMSAAGAVYVFERTGASWQEQTALAADGGRQAPLFGVSLAMTSDLIAIGSPGESASSASDESSGDAAYVFERSGSTWSELVRLPGPPDQPQASFGCSVGISGDRLVVGAATENSAAVGVNPAALGSDQTAAASGAAYVFTRAGADWTEEAYLKASAARADDQFGASVAIAGDNLVVTAPNEASAGTGIDPQNGPADDSANHAGAAYMFTRGADGWIQSAYIKASNTDPGDEFGLGVAISDDTIAIGAANEASAATGVNATNPGQTDNSAPWSGAAYVFH
jgi:hypothetical protein